MKHLKIAPSRAIFYAVVALLSLGLLIVVTSDMDRFHNTRSSRQKKFYPHMDSNPAALALAKLRPRTADHRQPRYSRALLTASPDETLTDEQIEQIIAETPPLYANTRITFDEAAEIQRELIDALMKAIDAKFRLPRQQMLELQDAYDDAGRRAITELRAELGAPIEANGEMFQIVSADKLRRAINGVVQEPQLLELLYAEEWEPLREALVQFLSSSSFEDDTEGNRRLLTLKGIARPE